MTSAFPYSPYLQNRTGPSPEKDHDYQCLGCGNQEHFIGIDDYGIPGRNYTCPHCGRPAVAGDTDRCWCPAYVSFKQTFFATQKGREPDRKPFRSNETREIQGGRIGDYTRIYCGECDDLIWVGPKGLAGVASQLLSDQNTDVLQGQEQRFLRQSIHFDLHGILSHIEQQSDDDPITKRARELDDREWQEALDRSLIQNFYDGLGSFYFSPFLQQRAELDEQLTQIQFTQLFERSPIETCLQINHRNLTDRVEVEPQSLLAALRDRDHFPSWITALLEDPIVRPALQKEEFQQVFDQIAVSHPRIAQTVYQHTPGLQLRPEQLQEGLLRLSRRDPQGAIQWLESHDHIQEALLTREVMEILVQVEDAKLRRKAVLMAGRGSVLKNPAGSSQPSGPTP